MSLLRSTTTTTTRRLCKSSISYYSNHNHVYTNNNNNNNNNSSSRYYSTTTTGQTEHTVKEEKPGLKGFMESLKVFGETVSTSKKPMIMSMSDLESSYNNQNNREQEGRGGEGEEQIKKIKNKQDYGYSEQDQVFKEAVKIGHKKVLVEYAKRVKALDGSLEATEIIVNAFVQHRKQHNISVFVDQDDEENDHYVLIKQENPNSNDNNNNNIAEQDEDRLVQVHLPRLFKHLIVRLIHHRYPINDLCQFLESVGAEKTMAPFKPVFKTEKPAYIYYLAKVMKAYGADLTIGSREHSLYVRALFLINQTDLALEEFEKVDPQRVTWFYLETMMELFIQSNRIPEAKKLLLQLRPMKTSDTYAYAAIDLSLALGKPKLAADYIAYAIQKGYFISCERAQDTLYTLGQFGEYDVADRLFSVLEKRAQEKRSLEDEGGSVNTRSNSFSRETLLSMMVNVYSKHPNRDKNASFQKYNKMLFSTRTAFIAKSLTLTKSPPNIHVINNPEILFKPEYLDPNYPVLMRVLVQDQYDKSKPNINYTRRNYYNKDNNDNNNKDNNYNKDNINNNINKQKEQ
ncbi:hypothetical protein DFA_04300 [Cavenderia fasciculata]|uniref:Uncharacterized protein n=1 Tax=Cavenderia fasciculata TaxID=261658 RepID=F4PP69_CACFS|nr:uncharacterized protein DFA_04300 [Cavenderia fasciculata]EGG22182.1 hypothetical protein DFA_04300 [Cavenderia fasciculata]|eukprot:XP_004360033.1 hypothetical protein DFA_04300 [Cavenderia fasciculata]